jgi:hypothetical protein
MLGAMLFNGALPVLDNVAAIAAEVVPLGVLGNATGEDSVAVAAVPVPVRDAVWGEAVALSATDSVAEKLAADAGVNVTYIEQLAPAANVAPHALAPVDIAKSLGLVPVMLGTILLNIPLPVLESVAAIAAEVVPLGVLGKATGELSVAVRVAAAADS